MKYLLTIARVYEVIVEAPNPQAVRKAHYAGTIPEGQYWDTERKEIKGICHSLTPVRSVVEVDGDGQLLKG